ISIIYEKVYVKFLKGEILQYNLDMKNTKKESEKLPNHLALYRKYRPSKFGDMLGQELALQILESSIKQNKIYHAYIFSGDRGTGKTTAARIFAREIGCSPDDIFELDAASNNSVEDIRLLIEASQSSTFGSRYKVYILDEAHMLSKSAFNALLKTLEEPPAHVIFILATTDKHKIPSTILSRCQDINFSSPSLNVLAKFVKDITKLEERDIDDDACLQIAKEGKGSFRDTLGVLEKILNSKSENKKILKKDVEDVLGIVNEQEILNIIKAICKNDPEGIIISLENLKLETGDLTDRAYLSIVKMFELGLYLRLLKDKEGQQKIEEKVGEGLLEELRSIATEYPRTISSSNLYKLLEIEKDLMVSTNLKGSILTVGLIRMLKEEE
ncbi:MAG: hypothetical protein RI945_28, partial [Candidatus Parcubacteria bacterium]